MKYRVVAILGLMLALFASCEKELVLNLPPGEKYLVVEGQIEADSLPRVILTRSVGFFDKIDISSIQFEKNAIVEVTDLNTNVTRKLDKFEFPFGNDTFVIYAANPFDPNNDSIKGKIGHRYALKITENNKIHNAVTLIPNQVLPDSIWQQSIDAANKIFNVRIMYKDPDTLGNQTKFATSVLRKIKRDYLPEGFLTTFSSTFNDAVTNGQRLPFDIRLGYSKSINFNDTTQRRYFNEQQQLLSGDTLIVKFMGIDYKTYQFWETLEYSRNSTGNPFASPTKVSSNVSDAIGIWGGYGSRYFTYVVK